MQNNIDEIITNWESEIKLNKKTLYKYSELTLKELEQIIKSSNIINKYLKEKINKSMTEDEIIKKYGENDSPILVIYALLNNLLNEPIISDDEEIICSNDSEKLYWQDIKRLEVFSQEKTKEYHQKYLEYIKLSNESTSKEDKEKYNKKALFYRNSIIEGNLRLVASAISKYHSNGMQFLDLINEGNIGLLKAVERFDPTLGYKFSTYAYTSVRRHVSRAIADKSRVVRQPVHFTELAYHVNLAREVFYSKYHREATSKELSELLDGLNEEKIKDVLVLDTDTVSLDTKVHNADENDDTTLGSFIASNEKSPEELIFEKDNKDEINEMLTVLTDRERYIIENRWGLNNKKVKTLEEVGKEINVTRERVRQIETKAFRKLKKFATSSLNSYTEDDPIQINTDHLYKGKTLRTILDLNRQDFEVYKSRLDKNSRLFEILLLLFGKDFNEEYNSKLININERKLFHNYVIRYTKEREKILKKYKNKNLQEITGLPVDCIECYLKEIGIADPRYKFLKELFGNKFNHRLKLEKITLENIEKTEYIIKELSKLFKNDSMIEKNGYQNKTMMDILNISDIDVMWLMNNQNKLTKSYEIIVKAFGYNGLQKYNGANLTNNEKSVLFSLLKAWKRKIVRKNLETDDGKIIVEDTKINIKKEIKNDLLPEIVKMLPPDSRMIVGLSLGIYNEKPYSIKELSFFYKKEDKEVIELLRKGIYALEEILNYYKKAYNGKIDYTEKDLLVLKRVQDIKKK